LTVHGGRRKINRKGKGGEDKKARKISKRRLESRLSGSPIIKTGDKPWGTSVKTGPDRLLC